MNDKPLRWGILSTAKINRALFHPLDASPRNLLVAVASRSETRAAEYARQWNISKAFGSYQALLDDPDIDIVYNPLPNHLHAEWTIKAVESGKHVLCEKPLALSRDEVDAIIAASERYGRIVTEAFMYRHHPQTHKVKSLVEDGAIGELQYIRGSFSFNLDREANYRSDPGMGGGSLWDVGCYPISFARFLAGQEPVEVHGWSVNSNRGVDNLFIGQLKFSNNLLAQMDSSFVTPFRTSMEIAGSEGVIKVPTPFKPEFNEKIFLYTEEGVKMLEITGEALYRGEVEDITDAVLFGAPPRVSLLESRGNVAVINALYESARSGLPVII